MIGKPFQFRTSLHLPTKVPPNNAVHARDARRSPESKRMICKPCIGYVKDTGTRVGRGVFAAKNFVAGELVEVCPVVILQCSFETLPTELQRRVFDWTALANTKGAHALALGYGSIYNHANPANLYYEPADDGLHLRLIAAVNVSADSELTINYNGAYGKNISEEDDWFQSNGVVPW